MSEAANGRVPAGVRAVFFDAVGTLIHPEPSAGAVYAEVGRSFGSRLCPAEVRRRFAAVFLQEEEADGRNGLRSDERREYQRWQAIVAAVLDDVADQEACFRALYEHFARPGAWRCEPGAGNVLRGLQQAGYDIGIASNFDHRLRGVLGGLAELPSVEHLFISSEVGWKKPAREFFALLCREVGRPPAEVLFVGDDPGNDHAGARACGLHALLLGPDGRSALPASERLETLQELLPPEIV